MFLYLSTTVLVYFKYEKILKKLNINKKFNNVIICLQALLHPENFFADLFESWYPNNNNNNISPPDGSASKTSRSNVYRFGLLAF